MRNHMVILSIAMAFIAAFAEVAPTSSPEESVGKRELIKQRMAERRAVRKAKFDAMTEEEKKAYRERAKQNSRSARQADRNTNRERIKALCEAAKAECGPNCYRVFATNGADNAKIWVGMTKEQYDEYEANKEAVAIKAKGYKHGPGKGKGHVVISVNKDNPEAERGLDNIEFKRSARGVHPSRATRRGRLRGAIKTKRPLYHGEGEALGIIAPPVAEKKE